MPTTTNRSHQETSFSTAPWAPRQIPVDEPVQRDGIVNQFPRRDNRLPLPTLSEALGEPQTFDLALNGIRREPTESGPLVPVALADKGRPASRRAVLGLPLGLARYLVDTALGRGAGSASNQPLSSGEQGALLYLLDRAAKDWQDAGGAPFSICGLLADRRQVTDYLEPGELWSVGAQICNTALSARASLLLTSLPAQQQTGPSTPGPLPIAGQWPIRLSLEIGHTRLALTEATSLSARDIVLLDTGGHPLFSGSPPLLRVHCGDWHAGAKWLDGQRFEMVSPQEEGIVMNTNKKGSDPIDASLVSTPDDEAAALEVVVSVEIGQVKLSVDQATRLLPGRIIRLEQEVGTDVALKVGDKLIGRGELVDHQGRLAVEITEVR